MRKLNIILLDLGNTLFYFDGAWPEVLRRGDVALLGQLQSGGLNLDGEAFLEQLRVLFDEYYLQRETEFIEYTSAYLLRRLLADWGYPQVPEALVRRALDDLYAITQAYWKLEPDAIPTLAVLLKQGYRLGLISNAGDDRDVQRLVDQAGLRRYLEVTLTSAAAGIRKPNPEIFRRALQHWGMGPHETAMVGDSLGADVLGARNAGLFSIWVIHRADTPANRAHQDTIQPDATIAGLGELPGLLAKLSAGLAQD